MRRVALIACGLTLSSCLVDRKPGPDAGHVPIEEDFGCSRPADCGRNRFEWTCTPERVCVRHCSAAHDCNAGAECVDGLCAHGLCVDDAECGSEGGLCVEHRCQRLRAPVTRCEVFPRVLVIDRATDVTLRVDAWTAQDEPQIVDEVRWDAGASQSRPGATPDRLVVSVPDSNGDLRIGASVQGVACSAALVHRVAAGRAGERVFGVFDEVTQAPLAGARIRAVAGSQAFEARTDTHGVATLRGVPIPFDLHVSAEAHRTRSFLGVDVDRGQLRLEPRHTFVASHPTSSRSIPEMTHPDTFVPVTLAGAAPSPDPSNVDLGRLLGPPVATRITMGSTQLDLSLPAASVMGLGDELFRSRLDVASPVGAESAWALGTRVRIELFHRFLMGEPSPLDALQGPAYLLPATLLTRRVHRTTMRASSDGVLDAAAWGPFSIGTVAFVAPALNAGSALVAMVGASPPDAPGPVLAFGAWLRDEYGRWFHQGADGTVSLAIAPPPWNLREAPLRFVLLHVVPGREPVPRVIGGVTRTLDTLGRTSTALPGMSLPEERPLLRRSGARFSFESPPENASWVVARLGDTWEVFAHAGSSFVLPFEDASVLESEFDSSTAEVRVVRAGAFTLDDVLTARASTFAAIESWSNAEVLDAEPTP